MPDIWRLFYLFPFRTLRPNVYAVFTVLATEHSLFGVVVTSKIVILFGLFQGPCILGLLFIMDLIGIKLLNNLLMYKSIDSYFKSFR